MQRFMIRLLLSLLILLAPILTYADSDFVHRQDVLQFINLMVKKYHFQKQVLLNIFSEVKLRPQVVHHVKKPLEAIAWNRYQILFVNNWRIKHGVEFWNTYAAALQRAEQVYGVPASIIVATIGIETKYGHRTGDYRVIDSLTNLAFSDSSRAPFFRQELEQFLLLTRDEHLDPLTVMGSYAGAIGQPQFMPSSYRYFAVNFSKSGKTDLMNNEVDVIGSIANYYKKHGWQPNEPVAAQAYLIDDRYASLANNRISLAIPDWQKYGIAPKEKLPSTNLKVKIIQLNNRYSKEYWLGFHNFYVIKRYNPSDLYAMAVYQLSTHIEAQREEENHG